MQSLLNYHSKEDDSKIEIEFVSITEEEIINAELECDMKLKSR